VTWHNAAIWVPIRGFVSRHLSMSLGVFRCRAPHTRPKEVGLITAVMRAAPRRPPYRCLVDRSRDVASTTTGRLLMVLWAWQASGGLCCQIGRQGRVMGPSGSGPRQGMEPLRHIDPARRSP
jgi:hypothetical protein